MLNNMIDVRNNFAFCGALYC